ncbi:MAG: BMP family protein [Thermomicrobiales bacterium]|nr:BMP family protein [Thermomicrobiales bacterium]
MKIKQMGFGIAAAALAVTMQAAAILPTVAQDASPAAGGVEVKQIALVTPGSRTNQGWDQQGADALDAVAKELGIEGVVAENAGYEDITPVLKDLAAGGANLIICHASGYQTVCPEFAAESGVPVAVIENPAAVAPNLVSDIETQAQEVAYLAGVLAAKESKTGTVGVVVSGEPPTWNYMTVGFAEGVHATNPDAKLLYSVIGEAAYDDAAGAKRVTEQQIAAGADVIFGMGDGASFGMLQAVEEHNKSEGANKVWFIDVIGDKRADHGDALLTSVLFDYQGIYKEMVQDLEAGTFGKVYTMDVKNGGVRLLDLPEEIAQDVKDDVAKAQQDIVDSKITVSAISDAGKMKARLDELFKK